jgi:hypothetical protein
MNHMTSLLPSRAGGVERQEQEAPNLDRYIGAREQQAVLAERLGNGDCHRQAGEHHREQK